MSMFNRCALAHDLLDGDWDARWVLADLLSEEGAEELADFARGPRRIHREGDLDLAIRLLPYPPVIALGCALLDHVMTGRGTVRRHAWLLAKLARIRRLLHKDADAAQLAAEGRALADYRTAGLLGREEPHLQEAARCLGVALEQAEAEDAAGVAIAALARSLRAHRSFRWQQELEWQIESTQQMLRNLIAAESLESPAGESAPAR